MIVQFIDSVMGTPVYVNPAYVVTLRPDPADPDHISIIKIRDGESIRVRGGDRKWPTSSRERCRAAGQEMIRACCRTLRHDWLAC
jgi:hypothetical protein